MFGRNASPLQTCSIARPALGEEKAKRYRHRHLAPLAVAPGRPLRGGRTIENVAVFGFVLPKLASFTSYDCKRHNLNSELW